jgi:glycosyltransferase involved in cell wall biosynthesis
VVNIPLVSVVIPAFNASNTLEQTLLSVSAQTYRNLEIIVVDDGSADHTAAIARNFSNLMIFGTRQRYRNKWHC